MNNECKCGAYSKSECGCLGVDWTDPEIKQACTMVDELRRIIMLCMPAIAENSPLGMEAHAAIKAAKVYKEKE